MNNIEIKYKTIKVIDEIKIDGKTFPNHQKNWEVVKRYEKTKDKNILKELVDFSLEF